MDYELKSGDFWVKLTKVCFFAIKSLIDIREKVFLVKLVFFLKKNLLFIRFDI
jgi:hypothetical protein